MSDWENFVAAAVLGTDRQSPPQVVSASGALAQVIEDLFADNSRTKEQKFLSASALLSIHQYAGRTPVRGLPAVKPIEEVEDNDDGWSECGAKAADQLFGILQGKVETSLLSEWLHAAIDNKKLAPSYLIPKLLDFTVQKAFYIETTARVVGARGRYLARLNPDWRLLVVSTAELPNDLDKVWQTGTHGERSTMLYKLRKADPARACALVESTWAEESYKEREAFVQVLRFGLSNLDEPLLEEKALADGRKDVRAAAHPLLAKIPDSRFSKRMIERVSPLISLSSDRKTFEVELPAECDKSMVKDGVETKPYDASFVQYGIGERQGWLCQMLATIRPGYWCERFNASPDELLQIANSTKEWRGVLLLGWARATKLHCDADWAEVFVKHGHSWGASHEYLNLLSEIPQARMERLFLSMAESMQGIAFPAGNEIDILTVMPSPWSAELSNKVLACIKSELNSFPEATATKDRYQVNRWSSRIDRILSMFGDRAHISAFGELDGKWNYKAPAFKEISESLSQAIAWMRQRKEIAESLAE